MTVTRQTSLGKAKAPWFPKAPIALQLTLGLVPLVSEQKPPPLLSVRSCCVYPSLDPLAVALLCTSKVALNLLNKTEEAFVILKP